MNRAERLAKDGAVDPIFFYRPRDTWGVFSNFSLHSVRMLHPWTRELVVYQTSEHRFQAMKACNIDEHDYVLEAKSPSVAKDRGREIVLVDGWDDSYRGFAYYAMFEAIVAKTLQHDEVSATVVKAKGRHIYEDAQFDDIWGWRYVHSYRGKNLLGRCWMDVCGLLG